MVLALLIQLRRGALNEERQTIVDRKLVVFGIDQLKSAQHILLIHVQTGIRQARPVLQGSAGVHNRNRITDGRISAYLEKKIRLAGAVLCLGMLFLQSTQTNSGQTVYSKPTSTLPDAPQAQLPAHAVVPPAVSLEPCPARSAPHPAAGSNPTASSATPMTGIEAVHALCAPQPTTKRFERFLTGPEVKPLTRKEKAKLAVRNVIDPFNALTIIANAGVSAGSNIDSSYPPGAAGFERAVGVSYTQDMTSEFFSTFLIPSLCRQDPRYHRMPNASIPLRIRHAMVQIVWTQGDNGRGMVNYGGVVGTAIGEAIGNLYVPGRQTNLPASASRYGVDMASAPIENFVSEFLPDVARHMHVKIVVIQRIINQVAKPDSLGQP